MLTFGIVVASNNLIALKGFAVFLTNYKLFEKPNWIERRVISYARGWIEKKAINNFNDLKKGLGDINLTLNDCKTDFFTVLYLAKHQIDVKTGLELFQLMSSTELEFEKLKKPKPEAGYTNGDQGR